MQSQHEAPMASTQTSSSSRTKAGDIGDNYEIPPPVPTSSFASLKDRIKQHYEICSDYYYSLWYVPAELSEWLVYRRARGAVR